MARLIAIDWDNRECRIVVAEQRRQSINVDTVLARDWTTDWTAQPPATDDEDSFADNVDPGALSANEKRQRISATLKAMLADLKVGRSTALVGVRRSQVELFELQLPKVDEDALPAVVQNATMQQSSNVTDDSIIDFVTRPSKVDGDITVISTALSASERESISQIVTDAGLTPERMLLRPFAGVSLLDQSSLKPAGNYLLINLIDDEFDLSVVSAGAITFTRTARLAGAITDEETGRRLNGEIARTLTVVSQDSGQSPQSIVVYGNPAGADEWIAQLKLKSSLEVLVVDPFLLVESAPDNLPADVGRFASLLGMIGDEGAERPPALDYLHPREIVQPADRKKLIYSVVGVLGSLLLVGGYMFWQQLAEYDSQIADLNEQFKQVRETEKKVVEKKKVADAIQSWQAAEVNWLDELRDLSVRWPGSQDVVISRMLMSPARGGGGVINLQGVASQASVVREVEERIRDEYRVVRAPRLQERESRDGLNWSFEASVNVSPREKEAYRPDLMAKKKAEAAAAEAKKKNKTKSKTTTKS